MTNSLGIACVIVIIIAIILIVTVLKKKFKKKMYSAEIMNAIAPRKMGVYEKYIKRWIDVVCAAGAMVVFSPLYLVIAFLVKIKLGSPVLFTQERPGMIDSYGKETIFKMYKFRTMTNEKNENGELLSDEIRLTRFGKWLRKTSLDELPEAFNILNGTMTIIGPRPQLVRDMVFMSDEQRKRHTAKPGLSGLAQIKGRNAISWEDKISWDLKYIRNINFFADLKIVLSTVKKVFIKQEGITQNDMATAEDFGDYLLRIGKIQKEEYEIKKRKAMTILSKKNANEVNKFEDDLISIIMPCYNSEKYIRNSIKSIQKQTYKKWELIIVDDYSSDNTVEVIKSIKDNRIRLFKNKTNKGAAISRNKALREAKGRWIAFLDSDDMWASEKLEKQLSFMQNKGYAFTYTDYRIKQNGKWMPYINTSPNRITRRKMFNYCYFSTITVMYDQTKVGLIQIADLKKNNDYAMWLKAVEKVNCYRLPECLSYYIKHDGSISSEKKIKLIKWHYLLFRKGMGINPIISFILMLNNLFHGVLKKIRYKQAIKIEYLCDEN